MKSPGILFASVLVVLLTACATTAPAPAPPAETKLAPKTTAAPPYCTHAITDPDGPIACIDDSDPQHPKVDPPDLIHANRTKSYSTDEQVEIRWISAYKRPETKVRFKHDQNNCVEPVICNGGTCTTKTVPQNPKKQETCYYSIFYQGKQVLDPGTDIAPCCP